MITTRTDAADARVHILTINRHERRNALDSAHCDELAGAVGSSVEQGARTIVITGDGSTFCAGADLDTVYGDGFRDSLYAMLSCVVAAPVPVIAAVNGPAIGAGTQLAIACDLRVADERARFAVPTARNGLAVDPWTVRRLALLAGGGSARGLLIGCDTFGAEQAHVRGLVDRLGSLNDALVWARDIATFAPLTLAYNKLALDELFEGAAVGAGTAAAFDACWASEDLAEGTRARAEKRPPVFEGR